MAPGAEIEEAGRGPASGVRRCCLDIVQEGAELAGGSSPGDSAAVDLELEPDSKITVYAEPDGFILL